eukprot:scaffold129800_cov35-Tisochrysis_lutea.AAC.1
MSSAPPVAPPNAEMVSSCTLVAAMPQRKATEAMATSGCLATLASRRNTSMTVSRKGRSSSGNSHRTAAATPTRATAASGSAGS